MACRIAPFSFILNSLQGHSPTACLFKCDVSKSCAAMNNISSEIALRGPSLIAENFIFNPFRTTAIMRLPVPVRR